MELAAIPTQGQGALWLFCLVLLVAASVSSSLVFACATPFAAFAVVAAAAACATIASSLVFNRVGLIGRLPLYPVAGLASFFVYELGLAAAVPVLGGADAFTAAIIDKIALVSERDAVAPSESNRAVDCRKITSSAHRVAALRP